MKTYSIILSALVIILLTVIFWPSSPSNENQNLLNQRDDALLKVKSIQVKYDSFEVKVNQLKTELLESKAVVKRSELALYKAKVNEKVYLKRIKLLSLSMSEVQADSAIMERFKSDPDSIGQKVFVSLAKLDESDSVRKHLEDFTDKLRRSGMLTDSVIQAQSGLIQTSRLQIETLELVPYLDSKIIAEKDKEIKKLKRRNKVLKITAPVLFVLGVLIAL